MRPSSTPVRSALAILTLAAAVIAVLLLRHWLRPEPLPLRIATSAQPVSAALHLAELTDAYRAAGLEAEILLYPSGKAAWEAVLAGEADVATAAETILMHAAVAGERPRCWAILSETRSSLHIVARADHGILQAADLMGKRIGVPFGTNAQFYLLGYLRYHGLPLDQVQAVDATPEAMVDDLLAGRLDAACIWDPYASRLELDLAADATVLHEDALYRWALCLLGRADAPPDQEAMRRLITALVQASAAIDPENPTQIAQIAAWCDLHPMLVKPLLFRYHYRLQLDTSLLLNLEDQARALYGEAAASLDFRDYLKPDILREVDPAAVLLP